MTAVTLSIYDGFMMKITETGLRDAVIIEPKIFGDKRGSFFEGFNRQRILESTGFDFNVAQTNHSSSAKHILRGLHYQVQNTQAKMVWTTFGTIYDVIVDLRRSSPDFGRWFGVELSSENGRRLMVPIGFAHGFVVLSTNAEVTYLTSDIYNPAGERFLRWNCPQIGIRWPVNEPILNERDKEAPGFEECEKFE